MSKAYIVFNRLVLVKEKGSIGCRLSEDKLTKEEAEERGWCKICKKGCDKE